jgi:hypothetical protein
MKALSFPFVHANDWLSKFQLLSITAMFWSLNHSDVPLANLHLYPLRIENTARRLFLARFLVNSIEGAQAMERR